MLEGLAAVQETAVHVPYFEAAVFAAWSREWVVVVVEEEEEEEEEARHL
jgi:hypothetical protein